MMQHGFDPVYQFMGHYVMALLYECTATLWITIELISERGAELWLTRTDVGQCKVEPPARDAPHNASVNPDPPCVLREGLHADRLYIILLM